MYHRGISTQFLFAFYNTDQSDMYKFFRKRNSLPVEKYGISQIPMYELFTLDEAVAEYERDGGSLTRKCRFGFDPLEKYPNLLHRRELGFNENTAFEEVFTASVAGNHQLLEATVQRFKNITFRLVIKNENSE